jgi:hypothetical protein
LEPDEGRISRKVVDEKQRPAIVRQLTAVIELVSVGGEVLETSELFAGLNGQMTPLAIGHFFAS